MLHELLLSLIGKTGQIIIPGNQCFHIDPHIDFLSDAEKEILNKICSLGYYYSQIEKYLEQSYQSFSDIGSQLIPHDISQNIDQHLGKSVYIKAFCYGIEEIMEEYQERVLDFERVFLKERRVFTLPSLSVKLSDYFCILPEIISLIEKISSNNLRGGQIIDLLQVKSLTGSAVLQEMYQKILKYTYKVLFHQITTWILYGTPSDYSDEFFITSQGKKERIDDWDSDFSLRLSMLPQTVLSINLAENILFIGKAQKVIKSKNMTCQNFKAFQRLSSNDLTDTLLFQNTIENFRFDLSQKLMDLILKEGNLMNHLKNLKDFYFLAKGEFYQIFIEEIKNIMKLPPTSNIENEINGVVYQNTILRLGLNDSQILKDIKFKIANPQEKTWNSLTVESNLKWPLNLFLSSQIMERYSEIFRFLFPIRVIQTELHQIWLYLIKKNQNHHLDKINTKILLNLRNKMSFFIDTLWSYFQLNVFEVEWKKFEEMIFQAKDFDEMRKAHEIYLISISEQIFLSSSKITKEISLIIDYCRGFVDLIQKTEIDVINDEFKTDYVKINKAYDQGVAEIIETLKMLHNSQTLSNISHLLFKLDFNSQDTF